MALPLHPTDFTPEHLTMLIQQVYPQSAVETVTVVSGRQYGDGNASTAGRCVFDVTYVQGSSNELPQRLVVKVARVGALAEHEVLYRTELDFYQRIRPEITLETPKCFGSYFDTESGTFGLIMEDLEQRGAVFMSNQIDHDAQNVRSVLDVFAKLHAKYWKSERFGTDLAWLQSHNAGAFYSMNMDMSRVPAYINWVTSKWRFKQEMLQQIGASLDELHHQMAIVENHFATLPQTLLHGDGHVGNTYRVGDKGGLLDWQLSMRGCFMHDVGYYIQTSLSVGNRRAWQRDLITSYLERLRAEGVESPPTFDEAWMAYRLTCPWNIYIGWLTADVDNYGWEICELAHLRVVAAYMDLNAAEAVDEIRGSVTIRGHEEAAHPA